MAVDRGNIPIQEKACMTVAEASEYSGIGQRKIRQLAQERNCTFVIWNGRRILIKRKQFEEFLEKSFSL